jgi:hypothetical protein
MYFVSLPDGRLQKVTYTVDGYSGYVAEVSYVNDVHYAGPHHGGPGGLGGRGGPGGL